MTTTHRTPPNRDEAAARQAKIARMIAAVDAQRRKADWSWQRVADLLDDLARTAAPGAVPAWWQFIAAQAGVRSPSEETVRLARVQLDTLAAHEADPFAGLPKAAGRG